MKKVKVPTSNIRQRAIIKAIERGGRLGINAIEAKTGFKNIEKAVATLVRRGWIVNKTRNSLKGNYEVVEKEVKL